MDSAEVDSSNWNIIYPTYLDKDCTSSQGRKINLSVAVSKPTIEEIKIVCEKLNIPHVVEEKKRYPRNWMVPGRVRVCLRDSETNEKTRTKKQVMCEIATLISQLKTRQQPKQTAQSTPTSKKKPNKKRR
ncbi:SRP19 family protein [Theileria parva strain Muguga]|uniref:Signal recognition particle, putative n=1 Tax=Theileria parva TaxID=5875 RepID=Q4N9F1_THEPA|nr:SRP19 family protein [Theileria parva strain Muguga]EAN33407.1 SRP19 family protein [Theileria parva strain Muguga]|eukprot:XP_765690.1 signal recognition particle [Theileria parva strain Muguga]